MRKELVVKGKSLTGTSDLTLLAPIIAGLVPSLDSMTYKSRVKRLLRTLQGGRASMHEYAANRPLSDSVERVAVIHSFRVVVLEPENKVMLAVTFDGTWESYIRVLWQKVGTLLDIIFCNTEGYVLSTGSFEEWTAWVSKVQVETSFFYNTHGLTVDDVAYVREEERIHRQPGDASTQDLQATRHHVESAEAIAWAASMQADGLGGLDTIRQGLQSLAVLFRVTDMYLPGTSDGDVLWRAARDLLVEFMPIANDPALPPMIAAGMRARFGRQLDWLNGAPAPTRPLPALPDSVDRSALGNVQAGILWPYEDMTHGCLVLLALDNPAAATALLDDLIAWTTAEGQAQQPRLVVNVAVTYEGLRACGLTEDQLALFPQEFREGMEARASMLGDFRANHPRRWRLPVPNWNVPGGAAAAPIELSAVHLVVQLRTGSTSTQIDPTRPDHPLYQDILRIASAPGTSNPRAGIRLLAVEGMRRLINDKGQPTEHFGFVDGESDPVYDKRDQGATYRNRVHVGDFVLGRDNEVDAAVPPATPRDKERREWLADGSFLVIRKLSQHVDRLHNVLVRATTETGLERDVLLAKMMGRRTDGTHLEAPGAGINDFNYQEDGDGAKCPFHAHIRRANPRTPDPDQVTDDGPTMPQGGRHPRLLRRGMSYGPPYTAPTDASAPALPDGARRGMVFMAYNASISEQFEVIQRWISGGNSSGGHSRQTDPFLGVPDWNEQRTYRFEDGGKVHRIALDCAPEVSREPTPLVRLEWGMYLFTPAIAVLRKLRAVAAHASRLRPPWSADEGEAAVRRLLEIEQERGADAAIEGWKALLEDQEAQEKFRSAGAWAAIRSRHGGVLRTAYGVIVADPALVAQVLGDTQGHYSVSGYRERMLGSIGEIFLGLDAGTDGQYERQSKAANEAVSAIGEQEAFELAMQSTGQVLQAFISAEIAGAKMFGLPRWELNLDAKEVVDKVLARLCQQWFGLPDDPAGKIIVPGSWRWDWKDSDPPIYPAHFTAPSRYIFQPNPGAEVEDYGRRIGTALTAALGRFIAPYRANGTVPQTPGPAPTDARLAKAILGAFPGQEFDELTARSMCGVLMGFLPTVDGNFRLTLNELLRDGSFWSLRAAWSAQQAGSPLARARQLLLVPMVRAMQCRPSPELVWRRATRNGLRIGKVDLKAGDKIVAAIVSAAHQGLEAGTDDVKVVFGGARKPPPAADTTHACPGYGAGMGVLLGMLAGFMNVAETMRPSPVPLAFTFEGPTPVPATGASQ